MKVQLLVTLELPNPQGFPINNLADFANEQLREGFDGMTADAVIDYAEVKGVRVFEETIEMLTAEYAAWCKGRGRPALSADEMLLAYRNPGAADVADRLHLHEVIFLEEFIARWEEAQERSTAPMTVSAELAEMLDVALATVELHTGNGAQSQPAWPRDSHGDIDYAAVSRKGRELLARLEPLTFISSAETCHTGGNVMVDVLTLRDGRAVGITDECIVVYPSRPAFDENDSESLPTLYFGEA